MRTTTISWAYRRTTTEADIQSLLTLYKEGRTDGGFEAGIEMALQGILTDSQFLFRIERGGYHGHPNPSRGEFVLNGGNLTDGKDTADVLDYPPGTPPERAPFLAALRASPESTDLLRRFALWCRAREAAARERTAPATIGREDDRKE